MTKQNMKIGDIDPRRTDNWRYISDKALSIGGGVLEAVFVFEIISLPSLVKSLGLDRKGENHLISLVGGGGKTTLLHALGKQLSGRTILTSTTKMGSDQNYDLRTLMKPDAKAIESITNNETVMIWKKLWEKKLSVWKSKPVIHGSHMLIMLL